MAEFAELETGSFVGRFLADSRTVHCLTARTEGTVRWCNARMAVALGLPATEVAGQSLWELMTQPDAAALRERLARADRDVHERFLVNFVNRVDAPFTLSCCCTIRPEGLLLLGESADEGDFREEWLQLNNEMAVLARENARQGKELERALRELEGTYWHLKKIQEVLPLCMGCGKVKAGRGWQAVVDYLRENALFLSHGYCPDCLAKEMVRWGLKEGDLQL